MTESDASFENEDRRFDVEAFRSLTEGTVGGATVTIEVEGLDETLAELINADLSARADELKQMVDHDVPPAGTERPTVVDWEAYLEGDLPKKEVDSA